MRRKLQRQRKPQYRTIYGRRYTKRPEFRITGKESFSMQLYGQYCSTHAHKLWPIFADHSQNRNENSQIEWMWACSLIYSISSAICNLKLHLIEGRIFRYEILINSDVICMKFIDDLRWIVISNNKANENNRKQQDDWRNVKSNEKEWTTRNRREWNY